MNHIKHSEDKHRTLHLRPNDPKQQHRRRSDWLAVVYSEYTQQSILWWKGAESGGWWTGTRQQTVQEPGCALTATKGNCVLVCISKNTASKQIKGNNYSTQHLLEHSCSTMSSFPSPPFSFRGPLQNWRESSKGPVGWELDIRKKFYLFSLEEAAQGYLITVSQFLKGSNTEDKRYYFHKNMGWKDKRPHAGFASAGIPSG